MAQATEMPFGMLSEVGIRKHVLDGGRNPPCARDILRGKGAAHCEVQGSSVVSCAKKGGTNRDAVWGADSGGLNEARVKLRCT